MKQSVIALLLGFFLSASAEAKAGSILLGSVKPGDGVKISDDDIFVVWSDTCSVEKPKTGSIELVEQNFRYVPRALVGLVGQRLKVRNGDKAQHNSFSLKNVGFDSGLQKPGSTFDVVLSKPGITKVFCRIHPKMAADVIVLSNACYRRLMGGAALSDFELPSLKGAMPTKAWLWSARLKSFKNISVAPGQRIDFQLSADDFLEPVPLKKDSEGEKGAY